MIGFEQSLISSFEKGSAGYMVYTPCVIVRNTWLGVSNGKALGLIIIQMYLQCTYSIILSKVLNNK